MQKKQLRYITKGMRRDLDISKSSNEYSYENRNIRITTDGDTSLLTVTNEKGTSLVSTFNIKGYVLGSCILGEEVVIFTTTNTLDVNTGNCSNPTDYIYKYSHTKGNIITLYQGNLNFRNTNPIEAIGIQETNSIKKVYWVDGRNEARMLNIEDKRLNIENKALLCSSLPKDYFDFSTSLKLKETLSTSKITASDGIFPSGVIQYAFCYYNLHGKQSPIIEVSPLLYTTHTDRGASPEESTNNSFRITINNPDKDFDYIRIYSIQRSTLDSIPSLYKVVDIKIGDQDVIEYIDNNRNTEALDSNLLYFIGGEYLIPNTIEYKDNTLFLGNITKYNTIISTDLEAKIKTSTITEVPGSSIIYTDNTPFSNIFQLHSSQDVVTTFQKGETYRLGVQFQDTKGRYSNPIWVTDYTIKKRQSNTTLTKDTYVTTNLEIKLPEDVIHELTILGYVRMRPLIIYPKPHERTVVCQGIVNPTIYNIGDRKTNSPYVQQSWFIRPEVPNRDIIKYDNKAYLPQLALEYRHGYSLPLNISPNAEIASNQYDDDAPINYNDYNSWSTRKNRYEVDRSILSFITPELIVESSMGSIEDCSLHIVGIVPITSSNKKYDIQVNEPLYKGPYNNPEGFLDIKYFPSRNSLVPDAYKTLGAVPIWNDLFYIKGITWFPYPSNIVIFPFDNSGDIGGPNTITEEWKVKTTIKSKKLLNYKYSKTSLFFEDTMGIDTYSNTIIADNEHKNIGFSLGNRTLFYRNTVDKLLIGSGIKDNKFQLEYDAPIYIADENAYNLIPNLSGFSMPQATYYNLIYSTILPKGNYNPSFKNYEKGYKIEYDLESRLNSPVPIKYKGSKHILVALKDTYLGHNSLDHTLRNTKPTVKPQWYIPSPTELFISNLSFVKGDYSTKTIKLTFKTVVKYIEDPNSTISTIKALVKDCILFNTTEFTVPTVGISISPNNSQYGGKATEYYVEITLVFSPELSLDTITNSTSNSILILQSKFSSYTDHTGSSGLISTPDSPILTPTNITHILPEMNEYGYMYLAEIRRNSVNNKFGGNNKENLVLLDWLIAGSPVDINKSATYSQGDTYYQRYEHINTMPYSDADINQIYDGISFMAETRINLNGRYDRNKGNEDLTTVSYEKFNMLNTVYNQYNNYFKLKYLDPNLYSSFAYHTQVVWSLQKSLGETIDTWTNISSISSLDLDASKGKLNSIVKQNNELVFFQDGGFGSIIFNPRVQIPVSDGVPIEISNSFKVEGTRYISEFIGCQNKWAICTSPSGIYFIDSYSSTLYNLSQGLVPLSDTKGFRDYFEGRSTTIPYYPTNGFINFRLHYDSINKDLYILSNEALVYSEKLQEFETFLDLSDVALLLSLGNSLYSVKDNKLWTNRTGEYLNFYGKQYPFSIEWNVNPDGITDKVFTSLDLRADAFEGSKLTDTDISEIEVTNEYQTTKATLHEGLMANKMSKYRIRRINIPRPNLTTRIRNPWVKIKLKSSPTNRRNTLNDMVITYYI